jgi:hypothetical protein
MAASAANAQAPAITGTGRRVRACTPPAYESFAVSCAPRMPASAGREMFPGTRAGFRGPSIAAVMRRRSLPQLVIPVPCRVDWNTMMDIDGEGRARFCDSCERPVYDSASMSRGDLADLIARNEGRRLPCVRLHRRPDGTIVTRDCFEPIVRVGRFLWLKVGLAAVAFWAWAFGLRSVVEGVRQRIEAGREWESRTVEYLGGLKLVERIPRDPSSLAPLPANATHPPEPPSLGFLPLISWIDRADPLRDLEADADIRQRLEPERHEELGGVP